MTRIDIYRQMTGQYTPIVNEYGEGKACDELYGRITDARERICARTGLDFEDRDILEIIECMEKISEICSLKMYHYALLWGNIPEMEEQNMPAVSRETLEKLR